MDCNRNVCYAAESCDTCIIKQSADAIAAGECVFPMEREVRQVLWTSVFSGEHSYGYGGNDYENDVFAVISYNWNNEDENDWHFHHKPSGFKLQWYKYPLRSCLANMEITHEAFLAMLRDCFNSLNTGFKYDIDTKDKWWNHKG